MEFADYRPFSHGDDIRAIDWSAYARNRHLLLKLFEEQQELPVHILLDDSLSMDWGMPTKFDQARRIAAGLSYLATQNLDRLAIDSPGRPANNWRPGRGRANFLRLLRHLAGLKPSPEPSALADNIRKWLMSRPQRGLVIWITDAWGRSESDIFDALDQMRHARHEVVLIELRHESEIHATERGEFDLLDAESGEVCPVVIDHEAALAFESAALRYMTRLDSYCRQHAISRSLASAHEPVGNILRQFLEGGGFVVR